MEQLLKGGLMMIPLALCSVVAAVVAWGAPQTWDFTRRLSAPKAAWCVAMLIVSICVMTTQAYNPFIYFRF